MVIRNNLRRKDEGDSVIGVNHINANFISLFSVLCKLDYHYNTYEVTEIIYRSDKMFFEALIPDDISKQYTSYKIYGS